MSKLIPGYVRNQGIKLYEDGELKEIAIQGDTIVSVISGLNFVFSFDDSHVSCPCELFSQKGFCQHLAAMEYYLKNDSHGQELAEKMQTSTQLVQEVSRQKSVGSEFLAKLTDALEDSVEKYRLSVEGDYSLSDYNLLWTLRLQRLPDSKTYIVRDIKGFLKVVRQQGYYQIGKHYYESLSINQFDADSRAFIEFLWSLIPDTLDFDASFFLPHFGRNFRLSEANFEQGLSFMQALSSFRFRAFDQELDEAPIVRLDADANLFHFTVEVAQTYIELTIAERSYLLFFKGKYLFSEGVFYQLSLQEQLIFQSFNRLDPLETSERKLQLDLEDKDALALLLLELQQMGSVQAPRNFGIHDFRPFFGFSYKDDATIQLQLALSFHKLWVMDKEDLEALPFSPHYQHLKRVFNLMESHGFSPQFRSEIKLVTPQDFYQFYTRTLPIFEEMGEVILSEELVDTYTQSKPEIKMSRVGDFLDISFDFDGVSQKEISVAYEALSSEAAYYVSEAGKMIIFDEETKRVHHALKSLRANSLPSGHLQLNSLSAYQLSQELVSIDQVTFSDDFQTLVEDLRNPAGFVLGDLGLKVHLRNYQVLGVKWLSMLAHYGIGGILADDMGLGKTLQTIAFLSGSLKENQTALILAPSSLIYNWQDEFEKFAPHLDVVVSYGQKSKRVEVLEEQHQITVTSYASFRQDFEIYQAKGYDVLILDEAQVIKNDQTKIANYLRQFEVKTCFALSGTPIENNLLELWSIFQIVLPDLLPQKRAFNKLSAKQVAKCIQPFVLRRRKEDVLTELPDLIEINHINELTDEQKAIYLAQIQQLRDSLASASDSEINRKKIEILSAITRLRQICDTPQLFMPDYKGDSGKLASLRQLLTQIQEGGHRVLIFSQFRTMLEIVEEELEALEMTSYKITGSTKANDRQAITRAFNTGSRDAVLISLKAGGVGINLTGADTVILVDLWWNPAVEDQAISRAYRMGQQKNVEFYRLITRGTIEEKIQALQDNKRQLITTVLDGKDTRSNLTAEDIREILNLPFQE